MTDLAAVEAAITPATKMLFLETSTNPRLRDRRPRRARGARRTATGSSSSPTTRSSGRRSCGRSSTARTSSSTPRRSTSPGHGDAVSGVVSGPQAAHRPDPQADGHVRPGGEPVQLVPRAARRADAPAALARRAPRTRSRWRRFLEAHARVDWVRYPGLAVASRTTTSRRRLLGDRYGAMVTFQPRGGVDGDGRVHGPPRAVRHRRQPGRRVHARLPAAEGRRDRPGVGRAARTSTTSSRTSSSGSRPLGRWAAAEATACAGLAPAGERRRAPPRARGRADRGQAFAAGVLAPAERRAAAIAAPIVRSTRRVTSSSGGRNQVSSPTS